ncbi:hypothetical protein AgCh_038092 [Apium graveolens]
MATRQYFQESLTCDSSESGEASLQKCNSGYVTEDTVEQGATGGFDCNICLDFVQDPVVTFCGHLYCWPCIYKWIHHQSVSAEKLDYQQPQCPVCKAVVSKETLVPLYGRGRTTKPSEAKPPRLGLVIPQRPSSPRCGSQTDGTTRSMEPTQQLHNRRHQNQHWPYYSMPEVAVSLEIFLDRDWEEDFPEDPTGNFGDLKDFIMENIKMCKWIGFFVMTIQGLCTLLAIILKALGPDHEASYESDDEYIPEGVPLLTNYPSQPPFVVGDPIHGSRNGSYSVKFNK